jgi:sugar phosphate isomerase/epimerase
MKQLRVSALNAKDANHLPMDHAREAAALAEYSANGIQLHAVGTIYFREDDDQDIRSKFEYARRAGVPVMVVGGPAPEMLSRIEKFVKQYDIRIAIHNHGPEDRQWPSPMTVLKAVKNMDPRMGCCIDVGHTVRSGTDVMEAVDAAGPRLFNVHMKDLADFHDKDSQVAVGQGKMPVRDIFKTLAAMRYSGYVDLEYEAHPENPMPGAIASFAYMRGVLAGLGCASCA